MGSSNPVFYYGNDDEYIVATSKEEALKKAKEDLKLNLKDSDLSQDQDVLDTWFSSWLWPISVFDGVRNPDNDEIKYYYPTQDLVTGPDINFLGCKNDNFRL